MSYEKAVAEIRRNAEQWRAFESKGHCVVLAGPGSGKTKVLTTKMARMLKEDVRAPRGIACLTFNNECARELERRLGRLDVGRSEDVFIGTLHGFCLRHVIVPFAAITSLDAPSGFKVASGRIQRALFARAMEEMGIKQPERDFRTAFDRFRRTCVDRDNDPRWEPGDRTMTDLCIKYEGLLREQGRLDFDDIVLLALSMIEKGSVVRKCLRARFPILVVDEYQDLGVPLHRAVLRIA